MYYFSKKIKCLDCGKNYKGMKQRKRIVWTCAGYSNYGKEFCSRFKIDQDKLLELVYNHYDLTLVKSGKIDGSGKKIVKPNVSVEELMERVDRIEVSPKDMSFTIFYIDNSSTFISPNHHSY